MSHYQMVNPGLLEITQLNLEEYKLEESEHLEFVCLILKRWKRMQMKRYALCSVITPYSEIHFIHMI